MAPIQAHSLRTRSLPGSKRTPGDGRPILATPPSWGQIYCGIIFFNAALRPNRRLFQRKVRLREELPGLDAGGRAG
jgi:hypothetical protein